MTGSVWAIDRVEKLTDARTNATAVTAQIKRARCDLNKTSTPLVTATSRIRTYWRLEIRDHGSGYLLRLAIRNRPTEVENFYFRFPVQVPSPNSPSATVPFILSLLSIFPV